MLSIRDETSIINARCKQFCKVHVVTVATRARNVLLYCSSTNIIAAHYIIIVISQSSVRRRTVIMYENFSADNRQLL